MMIRQPISGLLRFALGLASILLLIAIYTFFSHSRALAKRDAAGVRLDEVNAEIAKQEQALAGDPDETSQQRTRQSIDNLKNRVPELEEESRTAVDRAVPTWGSLYKDGLLRVTKPQGLRKDEYWLWEDATATFKRLAGGLLVGVILSVIVGILMGSFSTVEAFLTPPLSFLAKVPPTAMLAAFFVLVGTAFKMYVTMIAFGTLPTLAQTIYQSAKKDVPESAIHKAYTLGASHMELIWNVIYKQILPRVIDAIRLQVGPALVLLIAAEWMVAGEGFGYRLRLFYQRTDMTVVYLYTFLLGAVGLLADYILIWIRRWLCPWFGE